MTVLPPAQNVPVFPVSMVGVGGNALTVTVCPADCADEQPFVTTATVYVPEVETVMDWVVAPVDQRLFVGDDEVKTTVPPAQNVVGPFAVTVGVVGIGFTTTVVFVEEAWQKPVETVTEYDPELLTVIDCVVAPVDHVFPLADDEVKTTEPPAQNVVAPLAVIVGVAGVRFIVINCAAEGPDEQPFVTTATVYVPDVDTVID